MFISWSRVRVLRGHLNSLIFLWFNPSVSQQKLLFGGNDRRVGRTLTDSAKQLSACFVEMGTTPVRKRMWKWERMCQPGLPKGVFDINLARLPIRSRRSTSPYSPSSVFNFTVVMTTARAAGWLITADAPADVVCRTWNISAQQTTPDTTDVPEYLVWKQTVTSNYNIMLLIYSCISVCV